MCNLRIAGGACGVASRKVPIDFACETSRTELSSLSEKGDGDVYALLFSEIGPILGWRRLAHAGRYVMICRIAAAAADPGRYSSNPHRAYMIQLGCVWTWEY